MTLLAEMADVGLQDGFGPDDLFWWSAGILSVVLVLGALLTATRGVYRCVHGLIEKAEAIEDKVDRLTAIVVPNGGASLRDAVDRTERKTEDTDSAVAALRIELAQATERLNKRIDALYKKPPGGTP